MHRFLFSVLISGALASLAAPAEGQTLRERYSAGAPLAATDLPAGRIRSRLEALPPPARDAALSRLNELDLPAADLDSIEIDPSGGIFYVDPGIRWPRPLPQAERAPEDGRAVIGMTAARVFTLHSKPGAARKVYLNFRGWRVAGTAWNQSSGVSVHDMLPYSKDADTTRFSADEVNEIAETWRAMAEDYAPFDIDVTTERPASFGPNVGHVLFSPRKDRAGRYVFSSPAGGVAYVGVWGSPDFARYQPALVFPEGTGFTSKYMAEAGSHELGHNLGLGHDGTASLGYYAGHGTGNISWAPIMGVGYEVNVSQWSKGEYSGANNQQDDLAIIAGKLRYRPDDHGNTRATASKLVVTRGQVVSVSPPEGPWNYQKVNRGVIHSRNDVDFFWFQTTGGSVSLTVRPAWLDSFRAVFLRNENLNVRLSLYNASGALVATAMKAADTDATLTRSLRAGKYYLRIDGAGSGTAATGFTDYGSIGQYFIDGTVPGG